MISDILRRIIGTKRTEVGRLRGKEDELRQGAEEAPPPRDFAAALRPPEEVALIAEVKRRSPGAGEIRPGLDPAEIALEYELAGAAALSVLTDGDYFGGSLDDLRAVRRSVGIPVLRKDFVIDERQLWEARAAGADAVLLIVRILDNVALKRLQAEADALGMSALVEVHDEEELLRALDAGAGIIGINNRDLDTFRTRLEVTFDLLPLVPAEVILVSESGIRTGDDVSRLGRAGVDAVLVGESLLRQDDIGRATTDLASRPRVARFD